MEHWRHNAFGQIRRVARHTTTIARCCETHLVVDDHMNGTADVKMRCSRHHQHFLVDALTGECSITVQL